MRLASIVVSLVLVAFAYVNSQEQEEAQPCDQEACKLPNCRCSSSDIPGGLAARDTPQFVIVTFDDGVNVNNIETYRSLVYDRKNKNNCPAGVTFFVSHEYTDYTLVNELYKRDFEIALHSISHRTPFYFWRDASYETLMREIGDQRNQMAHFANIPINTINGVRSPFLQLADNATFQMMASAGLRYDLSWPTTAFSNPGLWPYTLHYRSTQDCTIPRCPSASIPGPWVLPINTWDDLANFPCSFVDACFYVPASEDEEGWFQFVVKHFERHYLGNRSPFGFYIHEWYLNTNPGLRRAFVRFLDMINNLNDVFMVKANEVIDWVQNPVPVNEYIKQACKKNPLVDCNPRACGPLSGDHNEIQYYMRVCSACPRTYPWVNNPLGE